MAPPSSSSCMSLLVLLLLLLLQPVHTFIIARPHARPTPTHHHHHQQQRRALFPPLQAELTQVEVRQATTADFGAIAKARNTVLFVPEGVAEQQGSFAVGSQAFPVRSEEERVILSRIPYLVAGQGVAFLVEGRAASAGGAPKVMAASVDVLIREAEGPSLPRRVFIKNMIVEPAFRRQGHARRLLARIEAYALEVGVEEVHLEVLCNNEGALALYESAGFEFLREPFNLLARALKIGKATMRKRVGEARAGAGASSTAAAAATTTST